LKTAKWLASALALALAASGARATLSGALEGDARGTYSARDGRDVGLNSLGASARKVFADGHGDRLILYAQAELADTFSEALLHQAYAEWKGPMGRWNVAAGRVPLPWGLLTAWSPDRMPYSSPYDWTRTLESDNGALLRGTLDIWDYGLALTQGYGMQDPEEFPGPGNLTGRVGVTPDEAGDVTMGLSFATGTVYPDAHGSGMGPMMMMDNDERERRTALALDCTWNAGRGTYRVEGGTRRVDDQWHGTLFAAADYALFPKITLQAAGQVYEHGGDHFWRRLYGGLAVPLAWFTIRGGYEYEQAEVEDHRVVLQVYRLFRFIR
jgi:hypothetical protein